MVDRIVPAPYGTIALALAACAVDDDVVIGAGLYAESNLRPPAGVTGVTVRPVVGDEGAVFIWSAGRNYTFVTQQDGFTLAPGLSIKNTNATYGAVQIAADNCAVSFVCPTGHAGRGILNGGANTIVDRVYQLTGTKGIVQASGASGIQVTNSVFLTTLDGVEDYSASDEFNFVLVGGTSGFGFELSNASKCRNCIAYGGTGGSGFYINHASADVDYCCAYGAGFADLFNEVLGTKGAHCITTDPAFVGGSDYHLTSASPCRSTGIAVAGITTDYDGVTRSDPPAIGPYAAAPSVSSAVHAGLFVDILVTMDVAVAGYGLDDVAKWTVTAPFGGTAVTVTAATVSGATGILLTVALAMDPDTIYRVTAASPVSAAANTADFVTPVYAEQESADAWALTAAGNVVDIGDGYLELVPWSADEPYVSPRDAVWISLFSDARVDPVADGAAVLPDSAGDIPYRGGWWADDTFGSKLWLLRRRSASQETINLARDYAREALVWLVTDGVAARVDVTTERFGQDGIAMSVLVSKADGTVEALRFPDLWAEWE